MMSSGCRPCVEARFAHLEQLRFGRVENADGIFALVGGASDGCRTDAHEPAQQALVLDDADVLFNDRPARQALSERSQISDAAYRLNLLIARQFVR